MILYDSQNFLSVLFYPNELIFQKLRVPVFLTLVWSVASYVVASHTTYALSVHGHAMLGGFVTFLLIFRANQSYVRYTNGKAALSELNHEVRDLVSQVVFYMSPPEGSPKSSHGNHLQ